MLCEGPAAEAGGRAGMLSRLGRLFARAAAPPGGAAQPVRAPVAVLNEQERAWADAIAPLIDAHYYFRTFPDVRHSGLSPAAHYVAVGAGRGFDPAPWFSNNGYVALHPDVGRSGMPPLVHYVLYGRVEGRRVVPTADAVPLAELPRQPKGARPSQEPHSTAPPQSALEAQDEATGRPSSEASARPAETMRN